MNRQGSGDQTSGLRPTWLLATGYALGLAGAAWDDLEHSDATSLGAGFAHLLMYLGIILALVGLILVLRSERLRAANGSVTLWRRLAAGGLVVLATGFVVDVIWHGMNPDATETNMLALPGHVIQQVGLVMGLAGAGALLFQVRLQGVRGDC